MDVTAPRPGSICTSVLYTPDVERSAAFYASLIGWTSITVAYGDGRHRLVQWQGKTVASIQQATDRREWIPHVLVDDIEAMTGKAVALGARIERTDRPAGIARLAVLRDLEGARFGLWQAAPVMGAEITDVIGSLWWPEVLSDDPPVAKRFYSLLFDWQTRDTSFEPFPTYTVFERDGVQEGGILPIGRDWGVSPHWNSIFNVADADATVRRACELGGSEGFIHTVPKAGRVGSLIDPDGVWFWVRSALPS
jgi:uncharacterized protein